MRVPSTCLSRDRELAPVILVHSNVLIILLRLGYVAKTRQPNYNVQRIVLINPTAKAYSLAIKQANLLDFTLFLNKKRKKINLGQS